MLNFADVLIDESIKKRSALVVGLDPDLSYFPDFLLQDVQLTSNESVGEAIYAFNKIVIDAVADHVIAVKPQLAYYEVYGSHGIRALERTISYARTKSLIVINDAKRGDIDSTSAAYARAFLSDSSLSGDMVTVNPFLGSDGYLPFVDAAREHNKGIFLLLKTSNPSSHELQDLKLDTGEKLYFKLADDIKPLAEKTKGKHNYSFIGAVVGATYPEEAKLIRQKLPHSIFLVPGFGAQGGKAEDLGVFFDKNGNGALISSSRGIIYCYRNGREDWKSVSEAEMRRQIEETTVKANEEINHVRLKSLPII
ncbi:orotidine-5'-phosphate decarboxylase [Paenibacillus sp. MMS18-CY102]|uniref:orotidine-5'-phosphate decarboxylase n=1 Tax=Paenibacillus sp. MMS18-CY102 TaxID=2682849 RepID=UPI0013655C9A|nr:orotidine-5'-phosphate decarboxylase [Paenibacillus sp. MMS18-CY102]MWC27652.1 orotidine-5'-phosphate decarboxylase [Paenibacillus sp. MMS18-CY102]